MGLSDLAAGSVMVTSSLADSLGLGDAAVLGELMSAAAALDLAVTLKTALLASLELVLMAFNVEGWVWVAVLTTAAMGELVWYRGLVTMPDFVSGSLPAEGKNEAADATRLWVASVMIVSMAAAVGNVASAGSPFSSPFSAVTAE